MDSVWGFVGIVIFGGGIYALYSYIKMKTEGEINASLLLGKDYIYKKCKDKEGYIKKAGPALLVFGIVAVLYGGVDIIHCYVYPLAVADTVGMILFFFVLIWFGVYTARLKKQFF